MSKSEYNLDIMDALKIVLNGGAVKGDNFRDGIFMKINKWGQLVIVDVNNFYDENEFVPLSGMKNQKFRELTVMTKKELSR